MVHGMLMTSMNTHQYWRHTLDFVGTSAERSRLVRMSNNIHIQSTMGNYSRLSLYSQSDENIQLEKKILLKLSTLYTLRKNNKTCITNMFYAALYMSMVKKYK